MEDLQQRLFAASDKYSQDLLDAEAEYKRTCDAAFEHKLERKREINEEFRVVRDEVFTLMRAANALKNSANDQTQIPYSEHD